MLYRDRSHADEDEYVSPLQEQTEHAEATLRVRVNGERGTYEIPVSKKIYFILKMGFYLHP